MKLNKCIRWNRYPDNPPKKSGDYLVTMSDIVGGEKVFYTLNGLQYSARHDKWLCYDREENPNDEGFTERVTAWAEQIEVVPYAG